MAGSFRLTLGLFPLAMTPLYLPKVGRSTLGEWPSSHSANPSIPRDARRFVGGSVPTAGAIGPQRDPSGSAPKVSNDGGPLGVVSADLHEDCLVEFGIASRDEL